MTDSQPPLILFNDDGWITGTYGPPLTPEIMREKMIAPYEGSPVDVFLWSIGGHEVYDYETEVGERLGDGYGDEDLDDRQRLQRDNLRWLTENHGGPVTVISRLCREAGMRFFPSVRMNEHYDIEEAAPNFGRLRREHPELLIGHADGELPPGTLEWGIRTGMNYAEAGARAHMLKILFELIDRFDIDGIELDFMRHPGLLPHRAGVRPPLPRHRPGAPGALPARRRRGRPRPPPRARRARPSHPGRQPPHRAGRRALDAGRAGRHPDRRGRVHTVRDAGRLLRRGGRGDRMPGAGLLRGPEPDAEPGDDEGGCGALLGRRGRRAVLLQLLQHAERVEAEVPGRARRPGKAGRQEQALQGRQLRPGASKLPARVLLLQRDPESAAAGPPAGDGPGKRGGSRHRLIRGGYGRGRFRGSRAQLRHLGKCRAGRVQLFTGAQRPFPSTGRRARPPRPGGRTPGTTPTGTSTPPAWRRRRRKGRSRSSSRSRPRC